MPKNKLTGQYIKTPFQETDTQFHPWDKLYSDIVGPLPMTEGHKYCSLVKVIEVNIC